MENLTYNVKSEERLEDTSLYTPSNITTHLIFIH